MLFETFTIIVTTKTTKTTKTTSPVFTTPKLLTIFHNKLFAWYYFVIIFAVSKHNNAMQKIAATKENNAKVKALSMIKETQWVGAVKHSSLDSALVAINLYSNNSGWYKPTAAKFDGIGGYFLINQDGSIYFESRVIKKSDNEFIIEYMSDAAFIEFEKTYIANK